MFEMESRIARDEVAPENLELLKIALKTAELAEENILKFYQKDVGVEWKADKTPVTIADKGTEDYAVRLFLDIIITDNYGLHTIINDSLMLIYINNP